MNIFITNNNTLFLCGINDPREGGPLVHCIPRIINNTININSNLATNYKDRYNSYRSYI